MLRFRGKQRRAYVAILFRLACSLHLTVTTIRVCIEPIVTCNMYKSRTFNEIIEQERLKEGREKGKGNLKKEKGMDDTRYILAIVIRNGDCVSNSTYSPYPP